MRKETGPRSIQSPIVVFDRKVDQYIDMLRKRYPALRFETCVDYSKIGSIIHQFQPEVVLCNRWGLPYPREAVVDAPSVRWVHSMSAGVDHLTPWDPKRIILTNSSGIFSDVMSQYVLGMILMFSQRVPTYIKQKRRHEWKLVKVESVKGKTLTVLGIGSIGGLAAQRAKSFGMYVIGVRANPKSTPGADEVFGIDRMHEALSRGDYVLNCLPLTEATRGCMNSAAFGSMKKGAFYINIGRGGVDDEGALVAALKNGPLAGAALDVFKAEPIPKDSVLWDVENLVITPHSSGETPNWETDTVMRFIDQLDLWLAGKPLPYEAVPGKGY